MGFHVNAQITSIENHFVDKHNVELFALWPRDRSKFFLLFLTIGSSGSEAGSVKVTFCVLL